MVLFDPVYKELSDEKLLGWQSAAVSALWKSRTRKFKVQSSGNRSEDMRKFTPEDTKYFKFYKDVLPLYAPDLYVRSRSEELFIDVGSAPGGLSKFLTMECGWRGYAFSLAPSEGGLEMKYSNPSKLHFSLANMTKENEWKRVVDLCRKQGFQNVHYVNIGVVVDFGQVDADGGGNAEMCCRSIGASISQFLILVESLKEGGSAMWIHSISHLDTLFFFMGHIVECFDHVRFLNTLSPARSPIYIIMRGFRKGSPAVRRFRETLLRDNGTITLETIEKWQVYDFSVIEDIMKTYPTITEDMQAIWTQKKDCLKETRLMAERRFKDIASSESLECKTSGTECRTPPTAAVEQKGKATSAAGVCSISSAETVSAGTSLLTVPKTFGPPSRRK